MIPFFYKDIINRKEKKSEKYIYIKINSGYFWVRLRIFNFSLNACLYFLTILQLNIFKP